MIELRNITKKFGNNIVLDDISLELKRAGVTAVLGPNGSGKSTLIKTVLDMVIPDKGQVLFEGQAVRRKSKYRNKISYLPQISQFPANLSCEEVLHMMMDVRNMTGDPSALIEEFGLGPEMKKQMSALSGGTQQKVKIVMALMHDSSIIILDEPTTGLDPLALTRFKRLIRKEIEHGKQIIITSHIMSVVQELADFVIFLLDGKIYFEGSVSELLQHHGSLTIEHAIAGILEQQESYVESV